MISLADRIKNLQAKINQAKTLGLSSSSSLAVKETTFTLPLQIVGTYIDATGGVWLCGASKIAYVHITPKSGRPSLIGLRLLTTGLGTKGFRIAKEYYEGVAPYTYRIYLDGGTNELDSLNRGQTLPIQNYSFKLLTTDDIDYRIEYKDVEIYHS